MMILIYGYKQCVKNVHITLADHFDNKESDTFYRIGFMLEDVNKKDCLNDVTVKVQYRDERKQTFEVTDQRRYTYNDVYTARGRTEVNYDRVFAFVDLDALFNIEEFTYGVFYNDKLIKGPFDFSFNLSDKRKEFKIVTFGDHDIIKGMSTVDAINKSDFDLLLLLGDYAYEIYEEDGKKGDDYFEVLEEAMCKRPVIINTGNHELIDQFQFLNSRFMIGSKENKLMKYGIFTLAINDLLIINFNWDYLYSEKGSYEEGMVYLEQTLKDTERKYKWKLFAAHRPNICFDFISSIPNVKPECSEDPFFQKRANDLLYKYKVDIVLGAHVHHYERAKRSFNYELDENAPKNIIIGSAGTEHYFTKEKYENNELKEKLIQFDPGFLELSIGDRIIRGRFVESATLEIKDNFEIYRRNIPRSFLDWFVTLVFIITLLLAALLVIRTLNRYYLSRIKKAQFKDVVDQYRKQAHINEEGLELTR